MAAGQIAGFISDSSQITTHFSILAERGVDYRLEQTHLFYKSIRRICPQMDVTLKMLPGGHCNGSSARNEKGTFDFNDALLEFLNS